MEWSLMQQQLDEYQVDVAGLVEMNLDFNKPMVRKEIEEKTKSFDKFAKISFSASKESYSATPHKPGGTITLAKGNWVGRVVEKGQDTLGRWTYMSMEGKHSRSIMFINFYRVCKKNAESGGCKIRTQQERDLYKIKKSQKDPREAVLEDLEKEMKKRHGEGYIIILFGDINEEVRNATRVQEFLESTELKNVMQVKHPGVTLPTTYTRGRKCLDLMAVSKALDDKAIDKCGFIPFHHGMPSDHRALYMDLKTEYIFTNTHVEDGAPTFKRFTTNQAKKCDKYLFHLEAYLEETRISRKTSQLEKEMNEYLEFGKGDIQEMIERCKTLFAKTTQLMIASEKKTGRAHYKKGKESSPILAEAARDGIDASKTQ